MSVSVTTLSGASLFVSPSFPFSSVSTLLSVFLSHSLKLVRWAIMNLYIAEEQPQKY